jgi:phage terminase large subunit
MVKVYLSYNPPRDELNWINKWSESKRTDPDYLVHHSSYKDIECMDFVSEQFMRKILRTKENDPLYYEWMYKGNSVGMGDRIYNMRAVNIVPYFPQNERPVGLLFSMDVGHAQSATACGCYILTLEKNLYLVDLYYYSPAGEMVKKAPSELSEDVHAFISRCQTLYKLPILNRTIDSAEAALRNQYQKDWGIRFHGVKKLDKVQMVEVSQMLVGEGRFYVIDRPETKIALEEMEEYRWDTSRKEDKPEPIKIFDHWVDSFQYVILDNMKLLNLGFKIKH